MTQPTTMKASDWTSEQYQAAISAALRAHDLEAVVSLLHGLAVVDPHAAELVVGCIELAAGRSVDPVRRLVDAVAEEGRS